MTAPSGLLVSRVPELRALSTVIAAGSTILGLFNLLLIFLT